MDYLPDNAETARELLPQLPSRRYWTKKQFDYIRSLSSPVISDARRRRNTLFSVPGNIEADLKLNARFARVQEVVTAGNALHKMASYTAAPAGFA